MKGFFVNQVNGRSGFDSISLYREYHRHHMDLGNNSHAMKNLDKGKKSVCR